MYAECYKSILISTGTPTSLIFNQENELKIDCAMGHELVPIVTMSTTGMHQHQHQHHQYHSSKLPELLDNSTEMPQYANTSDSVMMTQMDVFQQQNSTSVMLSPPPPPLTGVYPLQEVAEEVDENEM